MSKVRSYLLGFCFFLASLMVFPTPSHLYASGSINAMRATELIGYWDRGNWRDDRPNTYWNSYNRYWQGRAGTYWNDYYRDWQGPQELQGTYWGHHGGSLGSREQRI